MLLRHSLKVFAICTFAQFGLTRRYPPPTASVPGTYSPCTRHLQGLYPPPTGPVPGSPAFKVGSTYTVKTKDYEKTFTLSEAFTAVR